MMLYFSDRGESVVVVPMGAAESVSVRAVLDPHRDDHPQRVHHQESAVQ